MPAATQSVISVADENLHGVALSCLLIAGVVAAEKKLWAKSFLGKKAPEFAVEKWLTQEPDRKGKFVLVDFWATWCPTCRKAIPELNALRKKFGENSVPTEPYPPARVGRASHEVERTRAFQQQL